MFGEAFSSVTPQRSDICGGCALPFSRGGSHDCPYCHCAMHAWCGYSIQRANGEGETKEEEGYGVRRVCNPCFALRSGNAAGAVDTRHSGQHAAITRPAARQSSSLSSLPSSDAGSMVNEGNDQEWVAGAVQDPDNAEDVMNQDGATEAEADGNEDEVETEADHRRRGLNEEARELMRHPISQSCRVNYNNQNALFLLYCYTDHRELLSEGALAVFQAVSAQQVDEAKTEKETAAAMRGAAIGLLLSDDDCPVKLNLITGESFLRYLLTLRTRDDVRLSHSSYSNKRAALFHLFSFI